MLQIVGDNLTTRSMDANMSPCAKAILMEEKIRQCNEYLDTVHSRDPVLIAEILKNILNNMKSSPIICEIAEQMKKEIASCQTLFETNQELRQANHQMEEGQIEENMKKQIDVIFETCPYVCASLVSCLMSSNLTHRIEGAYGKEGLKNILRNRDVDVGGNVTVTNLQSKGNATQHRIKAASDEAIKDLCKVNVRKTCCCNLLSTILNLRTEGQVTTIFTIFSSLIMKVGGLTNKGFDSLSKLGVCASNTKVTNTLDDVVNHKLECEF